MSYPIVPSIKRIKEAVKVVRKTNFDNFTYKQMHDFFFEQFGQFAFPSVMMKASDFAKLPVYRVRDGSTFDREKENELQQYSFPIPDPKNQWPKLGRANWAGKSVFYSSLGTYSAISEIKELYEGKEMYIAKWLFDFSELKEDYIRVTPMFFGIVGEGVSWSSFFDKNEFEQNLLKQLGKLGTKRTLYFIQEVCKLFASPGTSLYKFTAYISNQTIYSDLNKKNELFFPILIYPSIETGNSSLNYAVHPLFVVNYMKLEKVFHFRTAAYDNNKVASAVIKIGYSKDGEIEWFQLIEEEAKREFYLDKVECQCGYILEGHGFEKNILIDGSNEQVEGEVVKCMQFDMSKEMSSEEFKTGFFKELNVPANLKYEFTSHFENKFSIVDEKGEEHRHLTFHGGKTFHYKLEAFKN